MYRLRFRVIGTMLLVMVVLGMYASIAAAEDLTTQSTSKVELTDIQKNELANLHKGVMEKKKELVTKYVEYGVITEEKGRMIISRFEERYKRLEQNGFMPKCNKREENKKRD